MTGVRCRAVFGSLAGMETLTLETDALSVVILVGKGADILSIVDRASGVDPLLRAPWGVRDPRHGVPGDSSLVQWVQRYPGGWQELLPNFGPACTHDGIEHTMHGEAAVMPWRAEVVAEGDDAVEVVFEIELLLTPLRLERRVRLERGRRVIALRERLSNAGRTEVEFIWGHHPAHGGAVPLARLPVGRGRAGARRRRNLRIPVPPARAGVEGRLGGSRSGTSSPSCRRHGARRDMVGYFLGFEQGWWAVTNREHRVGFGLAWDANVFPFTCFWHELRASEGFPWFGRGYALALEPVTSWPAAGIAEVARTTGTQRSLAPGHTVETEVWAVIYEADWGVERIEPGGRRDPRKRDDIHELTTKSRNC